MINITSAIEEGIRSNESPLLRLLVLGSSGSGKSSLLGTSGLKTLFLYTSGEDHGVQAAKSYPGSDILPLCLDYVDGAKITAEETYARLLDVLGQGEQLQKLGVQFIAVDGASELENIIRETSEWKVACATKTGGHNTFAEGTATIDMFRPVMTALKELRNNRGMHFGMSCLLDVKDLGVNGEINEGSARLKGYNVAESVCQAFGDIVVVGRMERSGVVKHKIQFLSELTKVSKDEKANLKRTMNFSPRLGGWRVDQLPDLVDADLSALVQMKLQGPK